jgi:hypothetical protein
MRSQLENKIFKIKVVNLIGKKENLGKVINIINKKNSFNIKKNIQYIQIQKKSFEKISVLASFKIEEHLTLSYININDDIKSNDNDSNDILLGHQSKNSNVNKMIFDVEKDIKTENLIDEDFDETDPLKINLLHKYKQYDSLNEYNTISKEIIKKIKKHTYMSNNYENILIIWEILYCFLILLGFNLLIHLIVLVFKLYIFNSFYIFYCGVLLSFLLYSGIKSVYKIMKEREREICMDLTNQFIIFCTFITLFIWIIINKLEKEIKDYLITETHYNILFISSIIIEIFVIIQNYSMNALYREYDLILETSKEK